MLQSTNKNKLYLYLFFFIFLSSIFNFKFLENYKNIFNLNNIKIYGISDEEKKVVQIELNRFLSTNIFELNKDEVLKQLNNFDYLDQIYVNKIIPSSLSINLSKTTILGQTSKNGENFYIGENGKLINSNQLFQNNKLPIVFGNFSIQEFLKLQDMLKLNHIDLKKIDKYFYFKNKRWDILFSNGLTLMLPSKNIEISIKIYQKLLENNSLIDLKILDLRTNNQIILTKNNE